MSSIRVIECGVEYALRASYFSRALVEHAKAVPGMRFEKISAHGANLWVGYADAIAAVVARLDANGIRVEGTNILPTPDSWKTARTPFLFATDGLRDYQVEGVKFGIQRSGEGCLIADAMRLGKSLQAVTVARAFKSRTLIMCPPHLIGVWGRAKGAPEGAGEVAKWWPDAFKDGVAVLETVKPAKAAAVFQKLSKLKKPADAQAQEFISARTELEGYITKQIGSSKVVICHYDIAYAWAEVLKMWDFSLMIADELHILSGYQSRRSNAIKDLRKYAARFIGLTGTPITNKPRNAHNVLDIIAPGRFGYFWAENRPGCFARLFCDPRQETVGKGETQKTVWKFDGRSNLDTPDGKHALTPAETLKSRLQYVMLRRLKQDVETTLPVKERKIIDVKVEARNVITVHGNMLKDMDGELRKALDLSADAKFKPAVEIVGVHLDECEKTIVATYRRAFTEEMAKALKKRSSALVEWVHGGLTQKERDAKIAKVRTHNGPACLVGTIDTISTGIDLSFAGVMTIVELVWEPHELEQLEERLYKFGDARGSLIEYIIARGTGDELILRGIISKLDTQDRTGVGSKSGLKDSLKGDPKKALARLTDALFAMRKAGTAV